MGVVRINNNKNRLLSTIFVSLLVISALGPVLSSGALAEANNTPTADTGVLATNASFIDALAANTPDTVTLAANATGLSHPFLLFHDISETPGYQHRTQSPWSGWQSTVISTANTAKSLNFASSWSGDANWVSQRGYYALNLALAYQITKDASYSAKAKEALLNLDVGVVPTTPPMMMPQGFHAIGLLNYAIAYDLVQPTMDAATDTKVRDKLALMADACYKENAAKPTYVDFVDWQGQSYPDMAIAGVALNDYTNPNKLSLSSMPSDWVKMGTDYMFVSDKTHTNGKPLISYQVDNEGMDMFGAYKGYYIDDFTWWAQIYTHFYGKNFFDVYPIAKKLLTAEEWTSLPDHYSSNYVTNGQMKYSYYQGVVNLLSPAEQAIDLNSGAQIDAASTLKATSMNMVHIYYNALLPPALPYIVYGDYSNITKTNPTWTSHLAADSIYQVFRQNWNDDSDWMSLITFNKSVPVYGWRDTNHHDSASFEYYGNGDVLLSDAGEVKHILGNDHGQSEFQHNTIAIEDPRTPFSASAWAGSTARGIFKGTPSTLVTPSYVQSLADASWMEMISVSTPITQVIGSSYSTSQKLSSPIAYERDILYPEKDYFIVIDRMDGTQTWAYRDIFRPSSLGITQTTSTSAIGHVNGALTIGSTSYNWQSLTARKDTATGITANSLTWTTTNPNGKGVVLNLYTVPSSSVLVLKDDERSGGYGLASEVYSPVVSFKTAAATDVYRATVVLSRYSTDSARTTATVAVTGTGNALSVASSGYQDYVYTGTGTSTFGSYSTDANTVFVRQTSKPTEYTMMGGSYINYQGSPLIKTSSPVSYLTYKNDNGKVDFMAKGSGSVTMTLSQLDPSTTYQVYRDGVAYSDWAKSPGSGTMTITSEMSEHEFQVLPSGSATPNPSATPTATPTGTPTVTPTAVPSATATPTVTVTPNPSATATPNPTVTVTPAPSTTPVKTGLVLWYDMSSTTSTLTDLSSSHNNGVVYGATYAKLAGGTGSRTFDGQNDYILVKNAASLNPTTGMTVEVLAKPTKSSTLQSLVSKSRTSSPGDGYTLWLTSGNKPESIMFSKQRGEAYVDGSAITANKWYDIVSVYDGSKITLYVNGVKSGSAACVGTSPSTMDLTIGKYSPSNIAYFTGSIANVMVYNRALTASEIKTNYNADASRVGLPALSTASESGSILDLSVILQATSSLYSDLLSQL